MIYLINTSKTIAIFSFLIGTIIFVLHFYFIGTTTIISTGIIFIIVAFMVNSISLLALIFVLLGNSDYRIELFKTCEIVLLNVPIAVLYSYILISVELSTQPW
jgi:hypothetical protein